MSEIAVRPLRIAEIAPLNESVPPRKYGAIESLVADLYYGLTARGHQVSVFASGDSLDGSIDTFGFGAQALGDSVSREAMELRILQLASALSHAHEFDVIHAHLHAGIGLMPAIALLSSPTPVIFTLHTFATENNWKLFHLLNKPSIVAVSQDQSEQIPPKVRADVIYNGIRLEQFPFRDRPDNPRYLAFLGRIRPEKGPHLAIDIARTTGLPLKMAGRVKDADRCYFDDYISPQIGKQGIEFVGELGPLERAKLLGGATATLVTSTLREPFGLVVAESMACGTPVIALDSGAMKEIIVDGVTGFVAPDIEKLCQAVVNVSSLDRKASRQRVLDRFSSERMCLSYEALFQKQSPVVAATPFGPTDSDHRQGASNARSQRACAPSAKHAADANDSRTRVSG